MFQAPKFFPLLSLLFLLLYKMHFGGTGLPGKPEPKIRKHRVAIQIQSLCSHPLVRHLGTRDLFWSIMDSSAKCLAKT